MFEVDTKRIHDCSQCICHR